MVGSLLTRTSEDHLRVEDHVSRASDPVPRATDPAPRASQQVPRGSDQLTRGTDLVKRNGDVVPQQPPGGKEPPKRHRSLAALSRGGTRKGSDVYYSSTSPPEGQKRLKQTR